MRSSKLSWFGVCAVLAVVAGCNSADIAADAANPWGRPTSGQSAVAATPPRGAPPVHTAGWNPTPVPQTQPPASRHPEAAPGISLSEVQSSLPTQPSDDGEDGDADELPLGLSNLAPSRIEKNFKKLIGRGPDEGIAQQALAEGERLFHSRQFDEAAGYFKTAAMRWPDSSIEEDALFYLAECYFFTDRYPKAGDTYARLIKKYGTSRHLDLVMRRQYAIGQYWVHLDRTKPNHLPNLFDKSRPWWDTEGEALASYECVWLNDPTGPLADDAVMATANAHFISGRYADADDFYDQLRTKHPQSEHQIDAHVLGLQAKLRTYQGPDYDGIELVNAEKLIDQTLTQFPDVPPEERDRVQEAKRIVHVQRAERDWEVGRHFDRLKYYRAARFYYKEVLKKYPDTPFADMARQRIEEIKDLPPLPPDRFKWLTNLFGPPPTAGNVAPTVSPLGF